MLTKLKKSRYMQYVSVLTATLGITTAGTYLSWPSPTLPILISDNSPLGRPITPSEATWIIASLLVLPLPFTFVAGWMLDKYGRKFCMLVLAPPLVIPWIIIIFAKSVLAICVARSIGGVGLAVILIGCSMYIGEIADKDIRGRLGTALVTMKLAGSIIVFSVGPFVSYVTLALICLLIPLLYFVLFYFMPESPYYLVKVGKIEEARKVMKIISSKHQDREFIEKKVEEIETTIAFDMKNKSSMGELFTNADYRKSLMIIAGLTTLGHFSGHGAIEPYLQSIMKIADSSITPEVSSIIFGVVPLPAVLLAGLFIDKLGRKPLLIISALGCAVALMAEGVYFYMKDVLKSDLNTVSWLPATGFILYQFMNSFGVGIVPLVMTSELFSTNIKGQAIAVSTCFGGLLSFLLTKGSWFMIRQLGLHGCFWLFSCCCLFGTVFVYFVVPETKGKSFADIQKQLKSDSCLNKSTV